MKLTSIVLFVPILIIGVFSSKQPDDKLSSKFGKRKDTFSNQQKRGLYGIEPSEILHSAPLAPFHHSAIPLSSTSIAPYDISSTVSPIIYKSTSVSPTPEIFLKSTPLFPPPPPPPTIIHDDVPPLPPPHKEITITKEIPVPYLIKVDRKIHYPIYVKIPHPYPVTVEKHIPVEIKVPVDRPYPVAVPVPKPYPVEVEKHVPYPVKVPVDRPYPVHVTVEKPVPYPVTVEKHVPYPVKVPVDRPYPVHITVEKPVPFAVEKRIAVPVPQPYPVTIEKRVPYPVYRRVAYPVRVQVPVKVPYPVHIKVPVPYAVEKPYYGSNVAYKNPYGGFYGSPVGLSSYYEHNHQPDEDC